MTLPQLTDQWDKTQNKPLTSYSFPPLPSLSLPGLVTAPGVADGERDQGVREFANGPADSGRGVDGAWHAGEHLETGEPLPQPQQLVAEVGDPHKGRGGNKIELSFKSRNWYKMWIYADDARKNTLNLFNTVVKSIFRGELNVNTSSFTYVSIYSVCFFSKWEMVAWSGDIFFYVVLTDGCVSIGFTGWRGHLHYKKSSWLKECDDLCNVLTFTSILLWHTYSISPGQNITKTVYTLPGNFQMTMVPRQRAKMIQEYSVEQKFRVLTRPLTSPNHKLIQHLLHVQDKQIHMRPHLQVHRI